MRKQDIAIEKCKYIYYLANQIGDLAIKLRLISTIVAFFDAIGVHGLTATSLDNWTSIESFLQIFIENNPAILIRKKGNL